MSGNLKVSSREGVLVWRCIRPPKTLQVNLALTSMGADIRGDETATSSGKIIYKLHTEPLDQSLRHLLGQRSSCVAADFPSKTKPNQSRTYIVNKGTRYLFLNDFQRPPRSGVASQRHVVASGSESAALLSSLGASLHTSTESRRARLTGGKLSRVSGGSGKVSISSSLGSRHDYAFKQSDTEIALGFVAARDMYATSAMNTQLVVASGQSQSGASIAADRSYAEATGLVSPKEASLCELLAELACRKVVLGQPAWTLSELLSRLSFTGSSNEQQQQQRVSQTDSFKTSPLRTVSGTTEDILEALQRHGIQKNITYRPIQDYVSALESLSIDTTDLQQAASELWSDWTARLGSDVSSQRTLPDYMSALDSQRFSTLSLRSAAAALLSLLNESRLVDQGSLTADLAALLAEVAVGSLELFLATASTSWRTNEQASALTLPVERAQSFAVFSMQQPPLEAVAAAARSTMTLALHSKAQFVIDPVTGDTYSLREVHCLSDTGPGIRQLTMLGLVSAESWRLPFIHPYSGRRFDTQRLDNQYPALFSDPKEALMRIREAFLPTETVQLQKSLNIFCWRRPPSELKSRILHRWAETSPWATVSHEELLSVSPEGVPYLLQPNHLTNRTPPNDDALLVPQTHLYSWDTNEHFLAFENGWALRESTQTWYSYSLLDSRRRQSQVKSSPVDIHVYLQQQPSEQRPEDVERAIERIGNADQRIAAGNQRREEQIRSQYGASLGACAQLLTERETKRLYIAQRVELSGTTCIYSPAEIQAAITTLLEGAHTHEAFAENSILRSNSLCDETYYITVHDSPTQSLLESSRSLSSMESYSSSETHYNKGSSVFGAETLANELITVSSLTTES